MMKQKKLSIRRSLSAALLIVAGWGVLSLVPQVPPAYSQPKADSSSEDQPQDEARHREDHKRHWKHRKGEFGKGHRHGDREHRGRRGMLRAKAKYLDFSRKYTDAVQDPYQAIGFAAVGIKELHRRAGTPAEAVKELEALLKETKNRRARNVLLFSIRQVYESSGDQKGFAEINRRILKENLAEVERSN